MSKMSQQPTLPYARLPEGSPQTAPGALPPENHELEAVLGAWHRATLRLEHTHEALREEVRRLTDELEVKNRELARKNRLADLGQVASHVAHEVRNNLVPVTLYLSLLRRRISRDEGSLEVLDKIAAGFTALDATVNDLLQFTSERDPQWQTFFPRKLIEDVCASLAPQMSAQGIETVVDVPQRLLMTADQEMLRRAVLNLVLNALDAMPDGGTLTITCVSTSRGVELEVADSGAGLSDDARARAFEPFFTTKRGGTGLGLAIVYRIAEVHGGDVTAANCPEGGAAFTLRIPQPQAAALEAAA
jgi:signal transduction histidine kinase